MCMMHQQYKIYNMLKLKKTTKPGRIQNGSFKLAGLSKYVEYRANDLR